MLNGDTRYGPCRYSSHPDHGVTITLRSAIPILLRETIKLADEETGSISGKRIDKQMTEADRRRMEEAVTLVRRILIHMGIPEEKQFAGTLNAGHPGGMPPLTGAEKDSLHHSGLPDNLYVADATILPKAMGNPPILTIMALAKKIAALL